mmetsp:Transcript_11432/g.16851  ORF Transcript_11432/g.16851 Transcript_11432/m.16851 type:complete len:115 (+) Transcript_11432:373-717(+)
MLHIFFSPRFASIVDRLWIQGAGPISSFYCHLYFYFLVTSGILCVSFIPVISRLMEVHVVNTFLSPGGKSKEVLGILWNIVSLVNFGQYIAMSTIVICIFWRTNYRIFTVADGR